MYKFKVTVDNIKWDIDYDSNGVSLPTKMELIIEVEDDDVESNNELDCDNIIEEKVSDKLSDIVGFCHHGFEITRQAEI